MRWPDFVRYRQLSSPGPYVVHCHAGADIEEPEGKLVQRLCCAGTALAASRNPGVV